MLGAGGLLGSALSRALRKGDAYLFVPEDKFAWNDELILLRQIQQAVQAFAAEIGPGDQWEVYWAAGRGTMGSTEASLRLETRALTALLSALVHTTALSHAVGSFSFASSAGAIYAGSKDEVITEHSLATPTTGYAREKIQQEEAVRLFAETNANVAVLIARFSTLYGNGQNTKKQQGLLSHIAASILRNKPVQIYVPFDTIRDYIAVDDAAGAMIASIEAIRRAPRLVTKIIASEQPTTIAEIVAIFKRNARRSPLVVTSASQLSALYSRRVQFRSMVLRDETRNHHRSLLVGIAQLLNAERQSYVRSSHE